ncbi:REP-associated tyrosine transposase [Hymenobacter weizhouensis]|uniref:REP-associated tyrosine transposase n=1 Tax=Hymenobacter sp. YIM 151500-1 TaxID=2987689 RepID=UPI0022278512|nr:transposase [Hymenobacter sp. YIM 151500-1]UYZ61732.1 transposase [Hymenobacter sp. YIM 151500-1]
MSFYQRNLPHFVPPGAILFITFRLEGSLPAEVLYRLLEKAEQAATQQLHQPLPEPEKREALRRLHKQHFARLDAYLDHAKDGPHWLREPRVATCVAEEIHRLAEANVKVISYCLMSNHAHLVVQLPEDGSCSYSHMMKRLKGRTALAANRLLGRTGTFWQHESYDHVVRKNGEPERVVAYVLQNPVKAGLVDSWQDWPYSYWNENVA